MAVGWLFNSCYIFEDVGALELTDCIYNTSDYHRSSPSNESNIDKYKLIYKSISSTLLYFFIEQNGGIL